MKTWFFPLAVVLCSVTVVGAQKDRSESRRFRVTSKAVLVDLVARDQSGALVSDLKKSEVEVYQDGRRQKITHFDHFGIDNARSFSGDASAEGVVVPKEEDSVAFAGPARNPRLVILLDLASIEPEAMVRVKKNLSEFLSGTTGDGAQFLLLTLDTGLHVVRGWSSDPSELKREIEALKARPEARSTFSTFSQFALKLEEVFKGATPDSNPMGLAANIGASFISTLGSRLEGMSNSMEAVFRYLRHYPGRKHLLFYSSGYPLHPDRIVRRLIEERVRSAYGQKPRLGGGISDPLAADVADNRGKRPGDETLLKEQMTAILSRSSQGDFSHYLAEVVDQANRSQVSIYSVDVRGLLTASASGGAKSPRSAELFSSAYMRELRQALTTAHQDFLKDLSTQTAAQAFLNSNDLKKGLGVAVQDVQNYYLIAYTPEGKQEDGKFHKIEVRLKRKGVSCLYRQGYLDLDNATVASQDILSAVRYPDLFQDYKIDFQTAQQAGKLKVTALIPARELRFRKEGKNFTGSLELFAVLLDPDGKWVGKNVLFSRGQNLQFTPERREQLKNFANVSLSNEVNIPKAGTYTLVLVVRQRADDSIVAVRHPLKIP